MASDDPRTSTNASDQASEKQRMVATGLRGWWSRLTQPWPLPAFTMPGEHGVELQYAGDRKVAVVRAIRQITGWSLVSATHAADSTPVLLTLGVSRGSADAAARVLAEAGATARVVRTADAL